MKPLSRHLRSLATSSVLAAVALAAPVASAQDVLVDKSEIRFVAKQLGVNVDGRFRKWKANVVFLPADLAKSKAEFDIDLKRSVLVGDRVTDIRAGAAAGVGCNLLYRARLESGEAETSMAATATIEKLADVIPFLDAQVAEVASASCIS